MPTDSPAPKAPDALTSTLELPNNIGPWFYKPFVNKCPPDKEWEFYRAWVECGVLKLVTLYGLTEPQRGRWKRAFDPDEVAALVTQAREAGLEESARRLENGYFLHEKAPPKLFATEAAAAIRRLKSEVAQSSPPVPAGPDLARLEEMIGYHIRGTCGKELMDWLRSLRPAALPATDSHVTTHSGNEAVDSEKEIPLQDREMY